VSLQPRPSRNHNGEGWRCRGPPGDVGASQHDLHPHGAHRRHSPGAVWATRTQRPHPHGAHRRHSPGAGPPGPSVPMALTAPGAVWATRTPASPSPWRSPPSFGWSSLGHPDPASRVVFTETEEHFTAVGGAHPGARPLGHVVLRRLHYVLQQVDAPTPASPAGARTASEANLVMLRAMTGVSDRALHGKRHLHHDNLPDTS
jgi:hypothetical protein